MRKTVVIVENFYEDPLSVRNYALRQKYYYPYEADSLVQSGQAQATWMASWFKPAHECPFKSSQALIEKLESATGEQIDMEHWNLGFPTSEEGKAIEDCDHIPRSALWNCSFHFKPDIGQRIGDGVHSHVNDRWNSAGETGWAGLIYLTPDAPLATGLRLWRNHDLVRNLDWMTPSENWKMIDAFGNVFNRLILCRSDLPHSGSSGWSDKIETGRLYQTFFFKVKGCTVTEGLRLSL